MAPTQLRIIRHGERWERPVQTPVEMQAQATLDRAAAVAQDFHDLAGRLDATSLPASIDRARALAALDLLIKNAAVLAAVLGQEEGMTSCGLST